MTLSGVPAEESCPLVNFPSGDFKCKFNQAYLNYRSPVPGCSGGWSEEPQWSGTQGTHREGLPEKRDMEQQ